jgi:hypothetical protein
VLGGPPLILVGGFLAAVAGNYAKNADGKPFSTHRSRGTILLFGFALGAAVGCSLGVGIVIFLKFAIRAFDQGVSFLFLTGPVGGVVGGAVGGLIAVLRTRRRAIVTTDREGGVKRE